jgi:hypothetical protein
MVNEASLLIGEGARSTRRMPTSCWSTATDFRAGKAASFCAVRGSELFSQDLDWLAEVSGPGFVRGNIDHLLATT